MTATQVCQPTSEWELTLWVRPDAGEPPGAPVPGTGNDLADADRLAELLAEFAGLLLRRPPLGAPNERFEPAAIGLL